jgi:hypothetical protein
MLRKILNILVYIFAAIGFILVSGYVGVRLGLTNTNGIIDTQREWFLRGSAADTKSTRPEWSTTEEWEILEAAIRKDESTIKRAAGDSGVSPRLITANLVAEQLRLFFTEREFYKQFFSPLKILGSQTQFSWGVMGMKEDTGIQVENYLKDPASPYYLGETKAHLLDLPFKNQKEVRFTRMTDQHDHYWSYLYAGIFMNQIIYNWQRAGFTIGDKPEIISTLYNIGFRNSHPNSSPQIGGSEIKIGNTSWSFGGLAGEFYYSDLLTDIFPR